jgi:anti-sigma28 factor (negative regulator of flagellin synthesis)
MTEGTIGSVGVGVVPDAENFWRRFEEQTRAGASEAGRHAGNEWQRGFRTSAGVPDIRVRADTTQARAQIAALNKEAAAGGLLRSLLPLAPALVPLAAAAAAGGAALVSMGVAGALAVKGIQADLKAANGDGLKFAAGLNVLKGDLRQIEQTSAHGVLASFQQATSRMHADLPAVNNDLAQTSRVLGDIAGHLLGAAVSGEHTFAPVLLEIARQVDAVAAKFEAWASGPGGEKFAATLSKDFQHVVPLLEDVAGALGHLVAASNGPGLAIVDELDLFAKVLRGIPTPVLSVLTTGIVSLKIAGTVSGLMDKLALSIRTVAVSEGEAAAAAGGFRGGLSRGVGFIGRATAGLLAFSIASRSAANATQGWRESSNDVTRFFGTFTTGLDDLASFHPVKFWSDLFGANADKANKAAGYVKALHSALDDMWGSLNNRQSATIIDIAHQSIGPVGSIVGDTTSPTVQDQIQRSYRKTIDETTVALGRQRQALATLASHSTVSQLATAYGASATAQQKNIDNTEKFLHLGGEQVNVYKGVTVTAGMYQAALAHTGGNLEAATGFIHAQIDALGNQKGALAQTSQQQQRLGTYISDLTSKYKLSGAQVDVYTEALGINTTAIGRSAANVRDAEYRFGGLIKILQNGSTATNDWIVAVDQFTKSADTAADRAALIGAALKAANGDTLDYANTMVQAATANQQLVTDFNHLKKGVLDLKTGTLDFHNAGAAPLLGDLQSLQTAAMNAASATYQHERSLGKASAATDAFKVYVNDTRGALIKQATQLGITKGDAKRLADQYFGIKNSGDLKKQIALIGQDKVLTALQGILNDLDLLAGKKVNFYVQGVMRGPVVSAPGRAGGSHAVSAAFGGAVSGPGTSTSDSIPAWLSDDEHVLTASDVHKVGGQAAVYRMRDAIQAGMLHFSGGGGVPGEGGGFTGVDFSGNANKYGVDKKGAAAVTFDSSALSSFLQQLGITTNAFRDAKDQLINALRDAKASGQLVASAAKVADRLIAYSQRVQAEDDRITKARGYLSNLRQESRSESSSVRSSLLGSFDVTQAGQSGYGEPVTARSFEASLHAAAARAGRTRRELKSLENRAKGNPALTALVRQLAENPDAAQQQIDALFSSSKADLGKISKDFGRLQSSAAGAGNDISSLLFGGKIDTAKALLDGVDPKRNPALAHAVRLLSRSLFGAGKETARGLAEGLLSERKTLVHAMRSLARDLEDTIKHDLGIHSPSKVFEEHGRNVVAGLVNGITRSLPHARYAAGELSGTLAVAASGVDGAGGRSVTHNWNIQQHWPVPEPVTRSVPAAVRAASSALDR